MISFDLFTRDPRLLGGTFSAATYDPMRAVVKAALGEPLNETEAALFAKLCGGRDVPADPVQTLVLIVGRSGGKTLAAAALIIYLSLFRPWRLTAGQVAVALLLAADKAQASVAFDFIAGLLDSVPALRQEVKSSKDAEIILRNKVRIEVAASDYRGVRGRSLIAVIADELAFWPATATSASPAQEVLRAVEPGLARFPNAMLVAISTPFSRSGPLYDYEAKHFGVNDPRTLVARGATRDFNATFDAERIAAALKDDPQAASSEYLSQWRTDISGAFLGQWIDDAIDHGITHREPLTQLHGGPLAYDSFVDPSGITGADSYTCGISHADGNTLVLDAVLEVRPPYNGETTSAAVAALCKRYRVTHVLGDNYAKEWPREALARYGITCTTSEKTKSDIYLELVAAFSSGRIRLLDDDRLLMQLRALQRRVKTGGRDEIRKPDNGHDDLPNAALGALWMSSRHTRATTQTVANYSSLTLGIAAELGPIRRLYDS